MTLVAGIDSSTQSCKVVVCDSTTGAVVAEGRAPHPDGTTAPPSAWWEALGAAADARWDDVRAVSVAGQQHGMVVVDGGGEVVRDALLWNDTRSAQAAEDLITELGGPDEWAQAVGLVPVASFTVTKLRWLAEHEPDAAARVEQVMLPHDWLTWKLLGEPVEPVTDRGDASGTGYWSPITGEYRPDLLRAAFGREIGVPRVAGPNESVGVTADGPTPAGIVVAPGTGDNMGAALGLGAEAGDVVVSIGTSGTAFAVSDTPAADASGAVAGFADATGRFLPLVATLNAARVLTATAELLGVGLDRLDELALAAPAGAGGLVLLPYLDGERSPNLPTATGTLTGLTRVAMNPANVARAAVEGMLCGLADGVDALRAQGVTVRRVMLIGGGAASRAVREVAAGLFGVPVVVPALGEYVARGAARQAAWALSGAAEPPAWKVAAEPLPQPDADGSVVREAYAEARATVHGR